MLIDNNIKGIDKFVYVRVDGRAGGGAWKSETNTRECQKDAKNSLKDCISSLVEIHCH